MTFDEFSLKVCEYFILWDIFDNSENENDCIDKAFKKHEYFIIHSELIMDVIENKYLLN